MLQDENVGQLAELRTRETDVEITQRKLVTMSDWRHKPGKLQQSSARNRDGVGRRERR